LGLGNASGGYDVFSFADTLIGTVNAGMHADTFIILRRLISTSTCFPEATLPFGMVKAVADVDLEN